MILHTQLVEQVIDGDERASFVKEIVTTEGKVPLSMVRKRAHSDAPTCGAVLLVHGFGQNRYTWHTSRRSFSAYLAQQGWDVFSVDLRGHGRSLRIGALRPRWLEEYIREDLPTCADEASRLSGHQKVTLVGHSMGGLVCYGAAATELRRRVRSLVSVGTPYHLGVGSRSMTAVAALLSGLRFTGAFDKNPVLPLRRIGRHLHRFRAMWDSSFLPMPLRAWLPGSVEDEVLEEYLHRAFDPTSFTVALDILAAGRGGVMRSRRGSFDFKTAFEGLERPLLVIAGSHDALAPPDSVRPAYDLSRAVDKSYRVFPLGHIDLIVGRQAPNTVWPVIGAFIGSR